MHLSISSFKKIVYAIFSIAMIIVCCISFLIPCFKVTCNSFAFYEIEKYSLDVINIGSSHVFCSINPLEMYRKKGITSYNFAAGSQPIWFSYYYLKEALKTQKPQVVLLDVYTVNILDDSHFVEKTQMNILDMKPSFNKYEAIQSSGSDDRWNIFWWFPKYHSRYYEVTVEDYNNDLCRDMMGYCYKPSAEPKDNADVDDISMVTDTLPISEKAELYLRKCIELCQKEKIGIVLINAPWADITQDAERHYNYVQKIAEEYGVDFIDGNRIYDKIGIDYRVDNAEGGHLSYTGSLKWTEYLSNYLTEHYELPDHRGEQKVWEDSLAFLDNLLAKEKLKQIDTSDEYFRYLTEETTLLFVAIAEPKGGLAEGKEEALQAVGLSLDEDERGYILRLPDGQLRVENNIYSDKRLYSRIYDDLTQYLNRDDNFHNIIMQYTREIADNRTTEGTCYVVFDPYSYQILDIVEFRERDGYCRVPDENPK